MACAAEIVVADRVSMGVVGSMKDILAAQYESARVVTI
jgi:hypothetical protein